MAGPLTKDGVDVFSPTDGSGNPRGADMAEVQRWAVEIENLIGFSASIYREATVEADADALATDYYLLINKASAGPTTTSLPTASSVSHPIAIKDAKGDAATNNIEIRGKRPNTATITIASPGVVTETAHGRTADSPIIFSTTGALPTGLAVDTIYYVKSPTTDTYQVAATPGGSAINTSGTQSGTHTVGSDTIDGAAIKTIDWNYGGVKLLPITGGFVTIP